MRKYQVKPTPAQWVMIICAAIILVALIVFGIWEIAGIISPELEDTFSEWAWDLDPVVLIPLTFITMILTIVFGWFTIHVWEGYVNRRRREKMWEADEGG